MNRRLIVTVFLIVVMFCAFVSKDKQNINVVFMGDSITAGPTPNVSPPKFASEYLKQHLNLANVQVSNMGLSGYTTVNFLPGHPTFAKVKAAADPFYANYWSIAGQKMLILLHDLNYTLSLYPVKERRELFRLKTAESAI